MHNNLEDINKLNDLTHFDSAGQAHMVDVGDKKETKRVAVASGTITMNPETLSLIQSGSSKKGDVLGVARIAAIQASKKTSELIPLCHPLAITRVTADFGIQQALNSVTCKATVETWGKTGVEMEALVGASNSALTIYDMVKALSHDIVISNLHLVSKTGGKSDVQKKI